MLEQNTSKKIRAAIIHTIAIYKASLPMICLFFVSYAHLQKAQGEKHWRNGPFLNLEHCIIQDSTSNVRISSNNIPLFIVLFLYLFPTVSPFHVTSTPLIATLILHICSSLGFISIGSTNFSLLDNGLCRTCPSRPGRKKVEMSCYFGNVMLIASLAIKLLIS